VDCGDVGYWPDADSRNVSSYVGCSGDAIGPTVAALRDRSDFDATRPLIEFYRSQSELRLLVPVV